MECKLREITRLNNEEPRHLVGAEPPYKKASLALEVKEVRGGSLPKEELAQEVSELKKCLEEMGSAPKGDQTARFIPGKNKKKDMK